MVSCLTRLHGGVGGCSQYKNKSVKELQRLAAGCAEGVKKFSHVNKKALDQFVQFTEQREDLSRRQEEVTASKRKIQELIEGLDRKKDEDIERTFRGVAMHFKTIFHEIVQSGNGELVMIKNKEAELDPAGGAPLAHAAEKYSAVQVREREREKREERREIESESESESERAREGARERERERESERGRERERQSEREGERGQGGGESRAGQQARHPPGRCRVSGVGGCAGVGAGASIHSVGLLPPLWVLRILPPVHILPPASPSKLLASPSELLASPSELLASPSELLASPS
jgi:hypothetical protein